MLFSPILMPGCRQIWETLGMMEQKPDRNKISESSHEEDSSTNQDADITTQDKWEIHFYYVWNRYFCVQLSVP